MLPETNPLYQVVKKVVSHLTESNKDVQQISEFSWSIHVVEDPAINAFVLPVSKKWNGINSLEGVCRNNLFTVSKKVLNILFAYRMDKCLFSLVC